MEKKNHSARNAVNRRQWKKDANLVRFRKNIPSSRLAGWLLEVEKS